MSIASEITRLQGVKTDILQAISDKGVEVPSGSMLADCPNLIASISGGGVVYIKQIACVIGTKVVDESGYVGFVVNDNSSEHNIYAIVVKGADYSSKGLGRVTFVDYGTIEIGGLAYRTVTIGNQTWMAENLQLDVPNSTFYNNDEDTYGRNGKNYGRLYKWDDAMGISVPGWHLPTSAEWDELVNAVGTQDDAGLKLKSTIEWLTVNGTDNYGFTVFPSGGKYSNEFNNLGSYAILWTATEYSSTEAYTRDFHDGPKTYPWHYLKSSCYFPVRLVKDSA